MDSRHTPSSPPTEDVQENPQSNEGFPADETFRTAPSTFAFTGPAPAHPVVANVPRLGSNELDLDNDPSLNPLYQARPRARSLDNSQIRRNPRGVYDNANLGEAPTARRYDGTDPRVVQPAQLQQQFGQISHYNYQAQPAQPAPLGHAGALGNVPRGGAGVGPNVTPRNLHPVHGHANPRADRRRPDTRPHRYNPPQIFPGLMPELPSRFENQRVQDAARYQPQHYQQQNPRPQPSGGPFPQVQGRPQIPPPQPQFGQQQPGVSITSPGDMVRWMQNTHQQGQQGNVAGGPYGAQSQQSYPPPFQQGYAPQGPHLHQNRYPGANFGHATATQGFVHPSQYPQAGINQSRVPSGYGQAGYYPNTVGTSAEETAQVGRNMNTRPAEGVHELFLYRPSEDTRPPVAPTGDLQRVGSHSSRRRRLGHQSRREEAAAAERDAERSRKRRRQVEDDSNDESMDDSLLEADTRRQTDIEEDDNDEDESRPIKRRSRKEKPAKKKRTSGKEKADPKKAQGSKRQQKTRRTYGEIVQREDGKFWFRANGTAPLEPTVRHEPSREGMLADARHDPANPNGPHRKYDVEPRAGPEAHNRTSYLESQRRWFYRGPHDWHHETLDPIFYRFRRGDRRYRDDPLGPLRWRGQVVLNNKNQVITDWPDMPLTLSSKVEGWRLEAMTRIDERISTEDFRDRMPTRTGRGGNKEPQGASALGNHRSRFREDNGLASWDSREGTEGYNKAIESHLTADQIAKNTTQGFTRLSQETIKNIRDENRRRANGNFAKRAGYKLLTEEERAARERGEKPTRTPMSSKPPMKAKKAPEKEPSSDPEAHSENSQHQTSEDSGLEEDEDETGNDPDADDSIS